MEKTLDYLEENVLTRSKIRHQPRHLRAMFQGACFCILVVGTCVFQVAASIHSPSNEQSISTRHLIQSCDDIDKADPKWLLVFYSIGVLYMFLALAIVCDEFFVPALEEMSSKRHLNLSMDVAGATLMAAGGSAPELFSSLFGTFKESEIGIGTIIGSAVFNVMFVIAMCVFFTKGVLEVTWWPLFRDSLWYAIGLVVLAVFVGVNSPEEIELWEAIVMFVMYILYCIVMWKNPDIYRYLTGKELKYLEDEDDGNDERSLVDVAKPAEKEGSIAAPNGVDTPQDEGDNSTSEDNTNGNSNDGGSKFDTEFDQKQVRPTLAYRSGSQSSIFSLTSLDMLHKGDATKQHDMRWHGTFRAGILKLLRDPNSWVNIGGVGIVAKISGDADYVFKKIDKNGDGWIDKGELRRLFNALNAHMTDEELDEVFAQLDKDGDGKIGQHEFHDWYTNSEELIRAQVHTVFAKLDTNRSGTLDRDEIRALLVELDPSITEKDVDDAINAIHQEGSREEITFREFSEWYQTSMIYERQKKAVEEDMEGVWENLKPPCGEGVLSWLQYIVVFPLVLVMALTIPDVRRPGWGKWCYFSFIVSIGWVAGFAYLMVEWAELIGNTIGIPAVVMGVTVLAAGTSVPDLLTSIIVARRGYGDMAVSSSIGSNIFDIMVGLPIPWIMFTAWPTKPSTVEIESDNIWISIFVLLGMLVFLIFIIHCQGWKLTNTLACLMLVFYAMFLAQAIVLELPFETCIDN